MGFVDRRAIAVALALGAFAAGCGGSSSASPAPTAAPSASPSPTPPPPTSTPTPLPPRPGPIVFLAQVPAGLVAQLVSWENAPLSATEQERGFPYSASASISPDGTRVAYVPRNIGGGDIFVAGIDGTRHTNLTNSPDDDEPPLWSPDSGRLAFISHAEDGSTVLRVIGANNGASLATLPAPPEGYRSLAWLPDGSGFAVLAPAEDGTLRLFTLSLDGSVRPLTASPSSEVEAAISLDGRIALVRLPAETPEPSPTPDPGSPATGQADEEAAITPPPPETPSPTPLPGASRELWLLAPGESGRRLEFPGLSAYSQLRWSPDGRYLSFLAKRESGAQSLYVLEPDTGAAPRVAFARSRVDEWTWSPDSRYLAIVAGGGACGRTCPRGFLHVLHLETGDLRALPDIRVVSGIAWGWE